MIKVHSHWQRKVQYCIAGDGIDTVKRVYNSNISFGSNVLATVKILNAEKDNESYLLFSNECDKVAYLVKQDELKLVII
jgi:hypothetical protein